MGTTVDWLAFSSAAATINHDFLFLHVFFGFTPVAPLNHSLLPL